MPSSNLATPLSEHDVRSLRVGDTVYLSGVIVTGRDAAHKFLVETFVRSGSIPEIERPLYRILRQHLAGGVLYHCGPIVRRTAGGGWEFVAAGPTTSIREEVYEPAVIEHFGVRGIIGKGGMGSGTLQALQEYGAVYLHAVGGTASLIADSVEEVLAVYKQDEFGTPEAFWVIRVNRLPLTVTMDSCGDSLHGHVAEASQAALGRLIPGLVQTTQSR